MRVTILGCGASGGVPIITGSWGECDPTNPRNRRTRASIAVEQNGTTLLVDTSPDLRMQCIDAGIKKIDAVLYTHDHADHTHGIDDLRVMAHLNKMTIPIYGNLETLNFLKGRFGYVFPHDEITPDIYRSFVVPHVLEGPFEVGGIPIVPFIQGHGYSTSIGYRFDKVAYSTDVVELEEASFKALEGIDVWVVDCITMDPRPTHAHLEKTLSWIERVKPKRAILTHMSSLLDYDKLKSLLPEGVEPGYDGLVFEV
jgi:phosphoribosyl 1,2-cyclic phosphate phosphodiesterase